MKTAGKHDTEEAHTHEHHTHEAHHEHEAHHAHKHETKREERAKEEKLPGVNYTIISSIIIVILLALIIFLLLRKPITGSDGPGTTTTTGNRVSVEFYVMSQCPYGTEVEDAIAPVLESMGGVVDFKLDFILQETSPGTFQSLHGDKEVQGNKVQLCAIKYYPDNYQWMKMIVCQNKDAANVNTNWEPCAKSLGMDVEKLRTCMNGAEGTTLLRESMNRALAKEARGSPTMYVGGEAYNGQRDALSFQRAICKYTNHAACAAIPECASDADCTAEAGKEGSCTNAGTATAKCAYKDPVKVELIVLNDAKCGAACDTANILQVSQQLFLGTQVKNVDVGSEEGKTLITKYGIEVVPAYLFGKSMEQTNSWTSRPDLASAFELKGDYYKLLDEVTGASYFVSEEKRKEYYAAIGIVKGDNKPQIDFFVMSYCPYGNQAEEGIAPVYTLLKDKAIFNPRYVIYENYGGGGADYCLDSGKLCSMHGIQELNQNVREMCVLKYMGIAKWFDFALAMNKDCTAQNADTCWEATATKLGLDLAKIKTCQKDEAIALLTADKALGVKLKVSGSPSVFIDGDAYGGGRTPEAYKLGLCAKFETAPAECSTQLAGATAAEQAATPAATC